MATNYTLGSIDGWQNSEAGKNIVKELFPPNYTAPIIKLFQMVVKAPCHIKINGGKEIYVDPDLGLNYHSEFKPISNLEFVESGISFHLAYGV